MMRLILVNNLAEEEDNNVQEYEYGFLYGTNTLKELLEQQNNTYSIVYVDYYIALVGAAGNDKTKNLVAGVHWS